MRVGWACVGGEGGGGGKGSYDTGALMSLRRLTTQVTRRGIPSWIRVELAVPPGSKGEGVSGDADGALARDRAAAAPASSPGGTGGATKGENRFGGAGDNCGGERRTRSVEAYAAVYPLSAPARPYCSSSLPFPIPESPSSFCSSSSYPLPLPQTISTTTTISSTGVPRVSEALVGTEAGKRMWDTVEEKQEEVAEREKEDGSACAFTSDADGVPRIGHALLEFHPVEESVNVRWSPGAAKPNLASGVSQGHWGRVGTPPGSTVRRPFPSDLVRADRIRGAFVASAPFWGLLTTILWGTLSWVSMSWWGL